MKQSEQISVSNLENVSETLLYPLISRYVETKKVDGVIRDPKSVEIIDSLDYDVNNTKLFPISQLGACFRTIIFDEAVNKFLKANPAQISLPVRSAEFTTPTYLYLPSLKCMILF